LCLRTYFDEVHTIQKLEITLHEDCSEATAKIVVTWEASRWNSPAPASERLMMDATQTWLVRRDPASGRAVIVSYIVDHIEPLPGSVPL
jgi:Ser/Thr protein kinase RdoA (MazF antagonist)